MAIDPIVETVWTKVVDWLTHQQTNTGIPRATKMVLGDAFQTVIGIGKCELIT